ncbi:MAG: PQQ-binding-like beta-propeller repeat protein, partial [Candidatus Acidiferrales bacterium]
MASRSNWMFSVCVSLAVLAGMPGALSSGAGQAPKPEVAAAGKAAKESAKEIARRIDLSAAMVVSLPEPKRELEAAPFATQDGKSGWVLRLPGNRPIATPAYDNGMLFVGGGYGSHEFYAVDSETGKIIWKIQTGDDGPTAAVVSDGMVAFNTESCTLVVVDEKTGRLLWQEWLGDPLMSQPAIDKGVLYMAHPASTGRPAREDARYHPRPASPGGSHRLLAAELRTGRHIWEQQIPGDVITAPVISDGIVYFTTFDGTSYS